MKKYAVFLFDDAKQGMERYTYLEDTETDVPSNQAIRYYGSLIGVGNINTATIDNRITINGVKFESQTTAYIPRNGSKEIVLAERIQKDEPRAGIPCAYCDGSGYVPASEDENETETIPCKECNGTGTFSIQELIRTDNRPEEERSDEDNVN